MTNSPFDLILVGGGLSAGLLAMAMLGRQADLAIAIIEKEAATGGNHSWSSFESDLSPEGNALAAPLFTHRWNQTSVCFPAYRRVLPGAYRTIQSDRFARHLESLPLTIFTNAESRLVEPGRVLLSDGRELRGRAVVDARGARPSPALDLGFQKFVGLELALDRPHGLDGPIIMDATVDQLDGYRFVYTLPLAPDRLLVEDTYYSDGSDLDRSLVASRVAGYAAAQGWRVSDVVRHEEGVLPIAIGGDIDLHLSAFPAGVAPIGLAAGLFHPVTGYSFPDAVALALHLARQPDISGPALDRAARQFAAARWKDRRFYRLLNKMLFRAARPDERWRVLQRFYRLDAALVARFYGGHSSPMDKLRILTGKPPVPIGRAVAALMKG